MSTVVIVPGLHGSEEQHWQSQWEHFLPDTLRVEQDDWESPDLERWSARIVETVGDRDNLWLVAHSFGVLASVHALRTIGYRVRGLFLVAPADPAKFGVQQRLLDPLLTPGILVASHSDPWLSWEGALDLADRWGLPVLDAGYAGHINVASGHGGWQQGLQWLEQLRSAVESPQWFHYQLPIFHKPLELSAVNRL